MTSRGTALLAVFVLWLGCGREPLPEPATGQILLYVTTDAPLPPGIGEALDPNAPPALFDRLRLDVFAPSATAPCGECSRDFALDRIRVRQGEASIGIVPPPGVTGYVARARLFRYLSLEGGEPPALSTVDVYAALPAVEATGIVTVTVVLHVDDVGRPRGSLKAPTPAVIGAPDFSRVGVWPKATPTACTKPAGLGEVCVPGGAFWMGHPHAGIHNPGTDAHVTRLVVLSPYFVDLREVTVAEFRGSGLAKLEAGSSTDPLVGPTDPPPETGKLTPNDEQFFCTYSDLPLPPNKSRENLPVNCVSWAAADSFCRAQGKRLPSEAEYEYLAGALRSDLFVWGTDTPACGDSVWGRGGFLQDGANDVCRVLPDLGGPQPAGQGKRDRLTLNGQEVLDLMGNVSEWTRDHWNRDTEPCWSGRTLLDNPVCDTPGTLDPQTPERRTVKGQSWAGLVYPAAARGNGGMPMNSGRGFRCVRPAN